LAPRACARSSSSSTIIAPASPITNPSRSASKGREARFGSPLRREIARIAPKPAIPTRDTGASVPPQIITSARPSLIASSPSPSAMFEAAHAVHSESSGPLVPSSIETQPAARLGMIWTIENGLTRSGPRSSSTWMHDSKDLRPPMPVATAAPIRSGSAAMSSPASASACLAAASARCVKRSIRRDAL
jgi:hypothetical protein